MQRASQIIGRITSASRSKKAEPPLDPEQVACAAWPVAVGPKIARYTRAVKLVRGKLLVEVEDAMWQRNLFTLTKTILRNLSEDLGPSLVTDLELRIMPPRREPGRAVAGVAQSPVTDEADAISDPGLRRVYLASRRRETA